MVNQIRAVSPIKRSIRLKWPFSVIMLIIALALIAGFRRIGIDKDSESYRSSMISFFKGNTADWPLIEPAFWAITFISQKIFASSVRACFLIFAFLGVAANILGIRKISDIPSLSYLNYICFFYILHEFTQIRAGVACGILLISIPDLANGKYGKYILKGASKNSA